MNAVSFINLYPANHDFVLVNTVTPVPFYSCASPRLETISPYVLLNIDDEVIAKTKTKKKVK